MPGISDVERRPPLRVYAIMLLKRERNPKLYL